jgi:hypothetical protein
MTVSLHAALSLDRWSSTEAADLQLRLTLRNDGTAAAKVYPTAAKLAAIASYAGIGISWGVQLQDVAGAQIPIRELRTWYGPPGNPPSPQWAESSAVKLAPGAKHELAIPMAWIPNAKLKPRQLDPTVIDPEGMDSIAGPHKGPQWPIPISEQIPLATASVLVVGSPLGAVALDKEDSLRGKVVAFVVSPGDYTLQAFYSQHSFMGVGEQLSATAAPIALRVL